MMNKCLISVFAVVLLAVAASAFSLPEGKTLTGFSYANCGQPSDPTTLSQLSISPDPLVVGQNLTITAKGFLSNTTHAYPPGDSIKSGQGYNVSLAIYKSVFGVYIPVPCIDNFGSCTYDLCTLLGSSTSCPLKPWGVPCTCPLAAGPYQVTAPGFTTTFPKVSGVSWLLDGTVKVEGTITDPMGKRLACIQIVLTISSQ